uniref:CONSTANS-like 7 n=1 Tax=Erycina pusilla TaxID=154679 RepID=M9QTP3_9ASPA|nr:CONSTANS-like 7 [Erycina pusilla]
MDELSRKHRSAANAVGGSTARACDGCLRKRARWYCGADDAFLCQSCDSSVHSANPLARRHQRLRLHTSSPPPITWRKRKARTPRPYRNKLPDVKTEPIVPELEDDEDDIEMQQLMYCVPVHDPLFNEFDLVNLEEKVISNGNVELGFENLDIDLFGVVGEEDLSRIKMEFDFDALELGLCGDEIVAVEGEKKGELIGADFFGVKKMGLRLDYDAVIDAWTRIGAQIDSNGSLPSSGMAMSDSGTKWSRGKWGANGEEREARVTRYREKRRTRLFSKKIRYQVRKLNAEKRPRMKGRFVKRTTLSTGSAQSPYQY